MNNSSAALVGPFIHENLTIFLIRGDERFDGSRYASLREAFEKGEVRVHETGNVGELEAENLSESHDLFIQAGEVLKGGRQDRTLGIDFIIPSRSGRVSVPAFCVESGRWHKRRSEDDAHFSSSDHSLHAKTTRLAAKMAHSQQAVWDSVAESQEALGSALNKSVHMAASPTSYQLSVEDIDLGKKRDQFRAELYPVLQGVTDAVGYAFYVNGQRNSADIYGSATLFAKHWEKLLDVAILEAISAKGDTSLPPNTRSVEVWLEQAAKGRSSEKRTAPPRTRLETKAYNQGLVFETFDEALASDAVLHTSIISN